jgi:hypothetical protein
MWSASVIDADEGSYVKCKRCGVEVRSGENAPISNW